MTDETFEKIKSQIKFDPNTGLVPAIIQDAKTKQVLVLCYMNDIALRATLERKFIHLYRRSQQKLMKKGETSGHTQAVKEFRVDCEGKSLLFVVDQLVAGCHKGFFSCYFDKIGDDAGRQTTEPRIFDPEKVY
ncbi:MAG TPA: phosphoribosyl-AMP cyclohydrolase [Candidatus Eisenbacteria bacterium]|nr:phosphoribosyl-AMP cyclohydrolase [Candidatus Eisenbacteria bacterium]